MEGAFILGNGSITPIHGGQHTYQPTADAKFADNSLVKVRRLKHLKHLPEIGAVVCCVPAGTSIDHVWADYRGLPRPLMVEVPAKLTKYIVAFEGDPEPHVLKERYLIAAEGTANIAFAR